MQKYIRLKKPTSCASDISLDVASFAAELVNKIIDNAIIISSFKSRELKAEQRSKWHEQRNSYITGSILASSCGIMGPKARIKLLLEKATYGDYKSFYGNNATRHGTLFECISMKIYEQITGGVVYQFNLIPHIYIDFLAVSTDGVSIVNNQIRNLEIKSLISKVINGKVKKEYYHQTQLQMECLNIDVTDFIEVKYELCNKITPEFLSAEFRGYIDDGAPVMTNEIIDSEKLWYVSRHNLQQIHRCPKWMIEWLPLMRSFWDEVISTRKSPKMLKDLQTLINPPKLVFTY